jgi:hypothetical protein
MRASIASRSAHPVLSGAAIPGFGLERQLDFRHARPHFPRHGDMSG